MGFGGFDRAALARGAPLVASLALHVVLVGMAAAVVPRASARILDAIPVELVTVESPRLAEAPPAPREPAKRITLPKPIAMPLPKPEPTPEPPARNPDPAPVPVTPVTSAPTVSSAPPATSPAPAAPQASTAPIGPGVSWIENTPPPPSTAPSSTVASIPRDAGVTRVARPTGGYQVRPLYPSAARRLGIQGTTMLRVHVLADGKIGEVDVEQSAGHPDLDHAAADAVRRWRFEPARRGDEAVAMWVRLPVEFRLK
jgi:periplasmic protein TonB